MTDFGEMKFFLGFEMLHQTDHGIFVSQQPYVQDLLRKFKMQSYKPKDTPLVVNKKLSECRGEDIKADASRCRSVGVLL